MGRAVAVGCVCHFIPLCLSFRTSKTEKPAVRAGMILLVRLTVPYYEKIRDSLSIEIEKSLVNRGSAHNCQTEPGWFPADSDNIDSPIHNYWK